MRDRRRRKEIFIANHQRRNLRTFSRTSIAGRNRESFAMTSPFPTKQLGCKSFRLRDSRCDRRKMHSYTNFQTKAYTSSFEGNKPTSARLLLQRDQDSHHIQNMQQHWFNSLTQSGHFNFRLTKINSELCGERFADTIFFVKMIPLILCKRL